MGYHYRICLLETFLTFIAEDLLEVVNLDNFVDKSKTAVKLEPPLFTHQQCAKALILGAL